jgi:rod shape-determining protein MreC
LEIIALWLVVNHNSPQGAAFFKSTLSLSGALLEKRSEVENFFNLSQENENLKSQNTILLQDLFNKSLTLQSSEEAPENTSQGPFQVIGGRIVDQTLRLSENYLTINKGSKDGVREGMGIFDKDGVVGRVKAVSKNYSIGISLLNTSLLISSKIKSNQVFGSINWDGKAVHTAKLLYVPRHVRAVVGDTVVSSGYSSVFPEGIMIGIISSIKPADNQNYLDIDVKLHADFSKLNHVYLVRNTEIEEIDSLYQQSDISNEY